MNQRLLTILAVVVGCILTATTYVTVAGEQTAEGQTLQPHRIRDAQHIYGNPRAPITIVEWSDVQCPFCKDLHPTLTQLVDESNGNVNWEYRHYPLGNHPLADDAAIALECVADMVSSEAFWQLLDTLFASQQSLSLESIKQESLALGVTEAEYAACLENESYKQQVVADMHAADMFGGGSTPFNVIVFPDGLVRPVRGALPLEMWQEALQQ